MTGWTLNGNSIDGVFLNSKRDWQELTLNFRTDKSTLKSTFRPVDQGEGKFEIFEDDDGDFEVEDRSDGDAQVTLIPPNPRSNLRTITDWYLAEYDESLYSYQGEVYDVTLNLVADGSKSGGSHGTVTQGSDEWLFEFADGEVATERVRRNVERGGKTVEGSIKLEMAFTLSETVVLEDSLNRQAATNTKEVEDGVDYTADENPNNRNTVDVTQSSNRDPNGEILPTDTYVATHWETQLINDEFSQVTLSLTPESAP